LLGVVVLADRGGPTQIDCGLASRFDGRHAGAHVLFGLERKMFGELFLHALVRAPSRCEIR
jgi:hypothetical protein